MPSASLQRWQNDRMPRLTEIDTQCGASLAMVPPNVTLVEENLRGYVVLLCAHFQGFCRDLYSECAQIVVSKVRRSLQTLIQDQFTEHHALDHGNPNMDNIARDFNRFDMDLKANLDADPANVPRRQHLALLNQWRNVAAHQGTKLPAGGPLTLGSLRIWRVSCDELATALDKIMYDELRRILKRQPW